MLYMAVDRFDWSRCELYNVNNNVLFREDSTFQWWLNYNAIWKFQIAVFDIWMLLNVI